MKHPTLKPSAVETMPADVEIIHMRGDAAEALSLVEIAIALHVMRSRKQQLPNGPVLGNHITNVLSAAQDKLARVVKSGEFHAFQFERTALPGAGPEKQA